MPTYNDKDVMFRKIRLTVNELEMALQLTITAISESFRAGEQEKMERLKKLKSKLQTAIIKEIP